jgi:uncharacterized protein YukE
VAGGMVVAAHPTSPTDAGALRQHAAFLRQAANQLEGIGQTADAQVRQYTSGWQGRWKQDFLSLWLNHFSLDRAAYARLITSLGPRATRLYEATYGISPDAGSPLSQFQAVIDGCTQLAAALEQAAHAVDQQEAQSTELVLDLSLAVIATVATVATFGALAPAGAAIDLATLGLMAGSAAGIGLVTAGTTSIVNQIVQDTVGDGMSFGAALSHLNWQEVGGAALEGGIISGLGTLVGVGLVSLVPEFGSLPALARVALGAAAGGGGAALGDVVGELVVERQVNVGDVLRDGLLSAALSGGFEALGIGPRPSPNLEPESGQPLIEIRVPGAGPEDGLTGRVIQDGEGSFTIKLLDPHGNPLGTAELSSLDRTLSLEGRTLSLPPGTEIRVTTAEGGRLLVLPEQGPPRVLSWTVSDGRAVLSADPRQVPASLGLEAGPDGQLVVPRGWRIEADLSAGTVGVRSPEGTTAVFSADSEGRLRFLVGARPGADGPAVTLRTDPAAPTGGVATGRSPSWLQEAERVAAARWSKWSPSEDGPASSTIGPPGTVPGGDPALVGPHGELPGGAGGGDGLGPLAPPPSDQGRASPPSAQVVVLDRPELGSGVGSAGVEAPSLEGEGREGTMPPVSGSVVADSWVPTMASGPGRASAGWPLSGAALAQALVPAPLASSPWPGLVPSRPGAPPSPAAPELPGEAPGPVVGWPQLPLEVPRLNLLEVPRSAEAGEVPSPVTSLPTPPAELLGPFPGAPPGAPSASPVPLQPSPPLSPGHPAPGQPHVLPADPVPGQPTPVVAPTSPLPPSRLVPGLPSRRPGPGLPDQVPLRPSPPLSPGHPAPDQPRVLPADPVPGQPTPVVAPTSPLPPSRPVPGFPSRRPGPGLPDQDADRPRQVGVEGAPDRRSEVPGPTAWLPVPPTEAAPVPRGTEVPLPASEVASTQPGQASGNRNRPVSWSVVGEGGRADVPEAGPRGDPVPPVVLGAPAGDAGRLATRTIPGAGEATGEVARSPVSTPGLDPRPGLGPESGPGEPISSGMGEVPWIQRLVPPPGTTRPLTPRVTRPLSPEQVPGREPGYPPAGDPDLLDPASSRPGLDRSRVLAVPGVDPATVLDEGSPGFWSLVRELRRRSGETGLELSVVELEGGRLAIVARGKYGMLPDPDLHIRRVWMHTHPSWMSPGGPSYEDLETLARSPGQRFAYLVEPGQDAVRYEVPGSLRELRGWPPAPSLEADQALRRLLRTLAQRDWWTEPGAEGRARLEEQVARLRAEAARLKAAVQVVEAAMATGAMEAETDSLMEAAALAQGDLDETIEGVRAVARTVECLALDLSLGLRELEAIAPAAVGAELRSRAGEGSDEETAEGLKGAVREAYLRHAEASRQLQALGLAASVGLEEQLRERQWMEREEFIARYLSPLLGMEPRQRGLEALRHLLPAWRRLLEWQGQEWEERLYGPFDEREEHHAALRRMEVEGAPEARSLRRTERVEIFRSHRRFEVVRYPAGATRPATSRVKVPIALRPDPDVTELELAWVEELARMAIEHYFNAPRHRLPDGSVLRVELALGRGDLPRHEPVRVHAGDFPTTVVAWGARAPWAYQRAHAAPLVPFAHEVGHLLGLDDEYADPRVPERRTFADGSLMGEWPFRGLNHRLLEVIGRRLGEALPVPPEAQVVGLIGEPYDPLSNRRATLLTAVTRLEQLLDQPLPGRVSEIRELRNSIEAYGQDARAWMERNPTDPDDELVVRARQATARATRAVPSLTLAWTGSMWRLLTERAASVREQLSRAQAGLAEAMEAVEQGVGRGEAELAALVEAAERAMDGLSQAIGDLRWQVDMMREARSLATKALQELGATASSVAVADPDLRVEVESLLASPLAEELGRLLDAADQQRLATALRLRALRSSHSNLSRGPSPGSADLEGGSSGRDEAGEGGASGSALWAEAPEAPSAPSPEPDPEATPGASGTAGSPLEAAVVTARLRALGERMDDLRMALDRLEHERSGASLDRLGELRAEVEAALGALREEAEQAGRLGDDRLRDTVEAMRAAVSGTQAWLGVALPSPTSASPPAPAGASPDLAPVLDRLQERLAGVEEAARAYQEHLDRGTSPEQLAERRANAEASLGELRAAIEQAEALGDDRLRGLIQRMQEALERHQTLVDALTALAPRPEPPNPAATLLAARSAKGEATDPLEERLREALRTLADPHALPGALAAREGELREALKLEALRQAPTLGRGAPPSSAGAGEPSPAELALQVIEALRQRRQGGATPAPPALPEVGAGILPAPGSLLSSILSALGSLPPDPQVVDRLRLLYDPSLTRVVEERVLPLRVILGTKRMPASDVTQPLVGSRSSSVSAQVRRRRLVGLPGSPVVEATVYELFDLEESEESHEVVQPIGMEVGLPLLGKEASRVLTAVLQVYLQRSGGEKQVERHEDALGVIAYVTWAGGGRSVERAYIPAREIQVRHQVGDQTSLVSYLRMSIFDDHLHFPVWSSKFGFRRPHGGEVEAELEMGPAVDINIDPHEGWFTNPSTGPLSGGRIGPVEWSPVASQGSKLELDLFLPRAKLRLPRWMGSILGWAVEHMRTPAQTVPPIPQVSPSEAQVELQRRLDEAWQIAFQPGGDSHQLGAAIDAAREAADRVRSLLPGAGRAEAAVDLADLELRLLGRRRQDLRLAEEVAEAVRRFEELIRSPSGPAPLAEMARRLSQGRAEVQAAHEEMAGRRGAPSGSAPARARLTQALDRLEQAVTEADRRLEQLGRRWADLDRLIRTARKARLSQAVLEPALEARRTAEWLLATLMAETSAARDEMGRARRRLGPPPGGPTWLSMSPPGSGGARTTGPHARLRITPLPIRALRLWSVPMRPRFQRRQRRPDVGRRP